MRLSQPHWPIENFGVGKSIRCMTHPTEMATVRAMSGEPGRPLRKYSMLILAILGAMFCASVGGGSALSLSSPLLFADDISQLAQPSYSASSDGSSRHLLQEVDRNTTTTTSQPLILAASRTDRPDPLNKLRKYKGGYNISSKHYGASVGYTGLPAWILALVWAALGLILLFTLCCLCCCCRHRKHEYSHGRLGYILPVIALVIFTLAAIAGSILLYYAERQFNRELSNTLNYVVNVSESTESDLRGVQSTLTNVQRFVGGNSGAEIASLNVQLNNTANDLQDKTVDNRKKIKDAINAVRIVLIVVAAVMLALVLLGLLFSSLGVRFVVYILVLLGWILVIGTWILCGIFIFLDNGVGDTCLAMQEWVDSPSANTSLDKFLPCDGAASARAFADSETYTNQIVNTTNTFINSPINVNISLSTPPDVLIYNQTGPFVPTLCNTTQCANNAVTLAAAPTVWRNFLCTVNANGTCITPGRLTPQIYSQLTNLSSAAESLTTGAVILGNAANCTFVRDVFTNIHDHRCHDLRKHAKWIWIGLILVSAGNMLSILLWIVFIRRKRYRYKGYQQQQKANNGKLRP